jgi:hypothetical protein
VGDDVKWRVRDGGDGGEWEERVVAWRWASGQRVWVWRVRGGERVGRCEEVREWGASGREW